jgi:hypothetical protein
MELTRRDALAAVVAVTGAGGAVASQFEPPTAAGNGAPGGEDAGEDALLSALAAAAEVVYPSAVEGHRRFVETYALGRLDGREEYRTGMGRAVADLDATARDWFDARFESLSAGDRDRLLRELGVDTADADPSGSISERIRYYVVDDLLFAFYASPAGGRLLGIENPPGYPGGLESYRRARMPPSSESRTGTDSAEELDP